MVLYTKSQTKKRTNTKPTQQETPNNIIRCMYSIRIHIEYNLDMDRLFTVCIIQRHAIAKFFAHSQQIAKSNIRSVDQKKKKDTLF